MREQFLKRLRDDEDSVGMVAANRRMLAVQAELREMGVKEDAREEGRSVGITSPTKTSMKISKAALVMFGGIKAHEED